MILAFHRGFIKEFIIAFQTGQGVIDKICIARGRLL